MNLTHILVILSFLLPMLAAILGRLRLDLAALATMAMLALLQFAGLGVLAPPGTPENALHAFIGFSQSAVLVLVCLFILTAALEKSGLSRWLTQHILRVGGKSIGRLVFLFSGVTAIFSLFMNDVAAGALMIPSVLETSRRTGIKPSKLLIPVSFGSLLGGMATYFTTANILAADILRISTPQQAILTIPDFFITGGFVALTGLIFLTFFSDRLLPDRESIMADRLQKPTGSEMEELYQLGERTWHVSISEGSALAQRTLRELALGENYGLTVAAIERGKNSLLFPDSGILIQKGDHLLLIGREERIQLLAGDGVHISSEDRRNHLSQRGVAVFELLVAPRSTALGKNLKDLDFRRKFGASVIALQRGEKIHRTDVGEMRLSIGDSLLVAGESNRRHLIQDSRDFILIEPSPADQPVCWRDAIVSLCLLLAGVLAAALGMPIYLAMLAAALLAILTGAITMQEAYAAIEWQVIFIVGSMYSLSQAMIQTGLAEMAGNLLGTSANLLGMLGLAGSAFLISALLTQFMGGQIVVLITAPIAISAALNLGADVKAIALAAGLGCSASFLTPMAHSVNLLVVVPGGYNIKDFFHIGWRIFVVCFIAFMIAMLLFW